MAATKVGFQLESSLASKHLTDAEFIKGGYLVVSTIAERDGLTVATDTTDGTIIEGSLCYCQGDKKFYQYDGSSWEEFKVPTKTSELDNDSNFLTSIPDDYITETELNDKGYLTAESLDGYAKAADVPTALADLNGDAEHRTVTDAEKQTWIAKQDALESGTNIKTVNGQSLLGNGDIVISVGSATDTTYTFEGQSDGATSVYFSVTSSEENAEPEVVYLNTYSKNELDADFDALKEEIVTDSSSWMVVDKDKNILLEAGEVELDDGTQKIGLKTTAIIAKNASIDNVYTKAEVNEALATKASADAVYTKTETVAKTEVYTKTEIDRLLDGVSGGSSETATSVKRALDNYIQSIDTELYGSDVVASWKAEDGSYDPKYASEDSRIDKKVDKVAGKDLSTNDFTDTYKGQLDGLQDALNNKSKVEASTINGNIKINGVDTEVYSLPTASADVLGGVKVGDGLSITNGVLSADIPDVSNFITEVPSEYITETELTDRLKAAASQVAVTYDELKALRDNASLIPGMYYRITDYRCTTLQANTTAANNRFDIIIQALSNNTLSETASADYHLENGEPDGYFMTGKVVPAVEWLYTIHEDEDGSAPYECNARGDLIVECGYAENNEGVTVPILYKNDEASHPGEVDHEDVLYYVGTFELDGELYDRWRKIDSGHPWDAHQKIYVLTNVVVKNNTFLPGIETGKIAGKQLVANLPAWELKYCLDNDLTRFAWAHVEQAISNLGTPLSNGELLVRQPGCDKNSQEAYRYAWGTLADVEDGDPTNFWYSAEETVQHGEVLYDYDGAPSDPVEIVTVDSGIGRGVIYYMKDEYGNECPYDFKNIMFERDTAWQEEHSDFIESLGISVGDVNWFYTFSWVNEYLDVEDLTMRQDLIDDGLIHQGTKNNSVGSCYCDTGDVATELPNILLISSTQYDNGIFYGCYDNTFGNYCNNNTFGSNCNDNTFGNYCNNNTFGNSCNNNTFGSNCFDNDFGNSCNDNTFGNYCYSNTFGDYCGHYTFGSNCNNNTFGNYTGSNDFGIGCDNNTFGNYCNDNSFGSNCSYNSFGSNCFDNDFGSSSRYNTFGDYCDSNTFGSSCTYNIFGASKTEPIKYVTRVCFKNDCSFIKLLNTETATAENYVRDITVSAGISGTLGASKELQVTRNAAPVVFEAANTTHIILD